MINKSMKITFFFGVLLLGPLYGCSHQPKAGNTISEANNNDQKCIGNTILPQSLADKFEKVEDDALLKSALGEPTEGKLCQGQVYQSKPDTNVTLYRAWNSTNPNSKLGKWWADKRPEGGVTQYRLDYEICYQWSPLDKLVQCELKAGVKIVVGTGQSAKCSEYLTYPVSDKQQFYIDDASVSVINCSTFDGEFSWKK